ANGSEVRRFAGHTSLVSAVGFTPDGRWAVSGGFDGSLVVWKVMTGEEVWRADNLGVVAGLAVDPKGEVVAVAAGRTAHVYRLADGHRVNDLPGDARVSAVAM